MPRNAATQDNNTENMEQQFDQAVENAYQESILTPVLDQDEPEEGMEQEEAAGMSMGMQ